MLESCQSKDPNCSVHFLILRSNFTSILILISGSEPIGWKCFALLTPHDFLKMFPPLQKVEIALSGFFVLIWLAFQIFRVINKGKGNISEAVAALKMQKRKEKTENDTEE